MERSHSNYFQWKRILGFSLTLWLVLQLPQVYAQDIELSSQDSCGLNNPPFLLGTVHEGENLLETITVTGTGAETATMALRSVFIGGAPTSCNTFPPGPPCTVPFTLPAVGITGISISGDQATIDITPTSLAVGTSVFVTLEASIPGVTCTRTYEIACVRKPVDLILVIDRSGSMECPSGEYNFPSCISPDFANDSRWSKLETAVNLVATKMVENSIEGDRLSIVLFDGAIKTTASGGVDATILNDYVSTTAPGFEANVSAILNDQTPPLGRNGTGIGGAMRTAVQRMPVDDTKTRAIMLFTDGEQNSPPLVREVDPDAGKFVEDGGPFFLNNGTEPNTIEKFTVGIGDLEPDYLNLLENIASKADNFFLTTTGSDGNFQSLLIDDFFNQVFVHGSPQMTVERQRSFTGGFSEKTTINKHVEKVFLQLVYSDPVARTFSYQVVHNGVTVKPSKTRILPSAVLFVVSKADVERVGLTMDGSWELKANDIIIESTASPGSSYTFSATADDHIFDMTIQAGKDRFKVGDKITPSATLSYAGSPVTGAKVSALLISPQDDLADVLARAEVKNFDQSSDPDAGSLYMQKLGKAIEANPTFLDQFVESNPQNMITLEDGDSDGTYTGEFSNELTMSGPHQVIYFVEHAQAGDSIVRQKRQSILVHTGDLDLEASQFTFLEAGENQTRFSILPVDTRGKRLGLGLKFYLTAENATITSVEEQLDGGYIVTISGELAGEGSISIGDKPIFEGNLSHLACHSPNATFIQKIKCFFIKLGLPGWIMWVLLVLLILLIIWLIRRKK